MQAQIKHKPGYKPLRIARLGNVQKKGVVINDKTGEVHKDKIMRSLTRSTMKSPFYFKSSKRQQDILESIKI